MKRKIYILFIPILCWANIFHAHRVLYSPVIYNRYSSRFEVAGKTGSYYWLLSEQQVSLKHSDISEQDF